MRCRVGLGLLLLVFIVWPLYGQAIAIAELDSLLSSGQFEAVRDKVERYRKTGEADADMLSRLSRAYVYLGQNASIPSDQEMLYRQGMSIADEAIRAAPKNDEPYVAHAIAAGKLALVTGMRERIELSRVIKDQVDRAIALNPRNPAAYHIRARWNHAVADLGFLEKTVLKVVYGGLPHASFDQAISDFQQAIRVDDRTIHHLELGKTYLRVGRPEEARACFKAAIAAPMMDANDPVHKKEARTLLAEL